MKNNAYGPAGQFDQAMMKNNPGQSNKSNKSKRRTLFATGAVAAVAGMIVGGAAASPGDAAPTEAAAEVVTEVVTEEVEVIVEKSVTPQACSEALALSETALEYSMQMNDSLLGVTALTGGFFSNTVTVDELLDGVLTATEDVDFITIQLENAGLENYQTLKAECLTGLN